jgi:tryptophan-rich sensory protein
MQVFLCGIPAIVESMKRLKIPSLILSVGICLFAGALGSFFTTPSIPTWYAGLIKPSFNPPNWIFGPVWTTIYVLMGVSFYMILASKAKKHLHTEAVQFFIAQLVFNILWSAIFFGWKSPCLAFGSIVALWILILFTIMRFYPIRKAAAFLLVPYIAWVSFAAILNFFIATLN